MTISKFLSIFFILIFSLPLSAQPDCLGERRRLQWFHYNDFSSIDEMRHQSDFPMRPDREVILSNFTSINDRYTDNYTSYIRGYLRAPLTGQYSFNISSDDQSEFYLSTDATTGNLVKIAVVQSFTNLGETDKYPAQTSSAIDLQQGQYYYFEVFHREGGGGDHITLKWKRPNVPDRWVTVQSAYLYDYTCDPVCPPQGTACDDGDASTSNDREDGHCNCFGIPNSVNAPTCVGETGFAKALYFDNIEGRELTHLYNSSNYPLSPSRGAKLTSLTTPSTRTDSINYGTVVKGYLTVPVTGNYFFNVTGSRKTNLQLSPNEHREYASVIAFFENNSSVGHYEYDREAVQTSSAQFLEKGKFYYFEINHKATDNDDRFNISWRTPFHPDQRFRKIDGIYLSEYTCETACFPIGTPCDDGSSLTSNDTINVDCICVGIPCPDGNCEEAPYVAPEKCGVTDELDTNPADAWLTCQDKESPNPARGNSKWIQYDLGQSYYLSKAHIWNYNVPNSLGNGFKQVAIDYSLDGTNWNALGTFNWPQASGQVGYKGFDETHFGVVAQYILITALSNWDDSGCSGISKANFTVNDCLLVGKSCNDSNPHTNQDTYDIDCNCVGLPVVENICSQENRIQGNIPIEANNYDARRIIETKAIINPAYEVSFVAGKSITFQPGFHAKAGSDVLAMIETCPILRDTTVSSLLATATQARTATPIELVEETSSEATSLSLVKKELTNLAPISLNISPNPVHHWTTLTFNLPTTGQTNLAVYDTNGQLIITLMNNQFQEAGTYSKRFPSQRLVNGMYVVKLQTDEAVIAKNMVVIK